MVFASAALSMMVGAATGCDSGGGGSGAEVPGTGSCTLEEMIPIGGSTPTTLRICQELVGGASASDLDNLRQGCMLPAGSATGGVQAEAHFLPAPCPHDDALGGCRITQAGKTVGNWYYKAGPSDDSQPSEIQQLCATIGGTFVPP